MVEVFNDAGLDHILDLKDVPGIHEAGKMKNTVMRSFRDTHVPFIHEERAVVTDCVKLPQEELLSFIHSPLSCHLRRANKELFFTFLYPNGYRIDGKLILWNNNRSTGL